MRIGLVEIRERAIERGRAVLERSARSQDEVRRRVIRRLDEERRLRDADARVVVGHGRRDRVGAGRGVRVCRREGLRRRGCVCLGPSGAVVAPVKDDVEGIEHPRIRERTRDGHAVADHECRRRGRHRDCRRDVADDEVRRLDDRDEAVAVLEREGHDVGVLRGPAGRVVTIGVRERERPIVHREAHGLARLTGAPIDGDVGKDIRRETERPVRGDELTLVHRRDIEGDAREAGRRARRGERRGARTERRDCDREGPHQGRPHLRLHFP